MKYLNMKLVGVTYDNPDGTNRQDVFRRLAESLREEYEKDELYGSFSKKEQLENEYEYLEEFEDIPVKLSCHTYQYDGKPALYIKCDYGILGNIPADEVENILSLPNALFFGYITGGNVRKIDDTGDEDRVITEKLTYGMKLAIEIND